MYPPCREQTGRQAPTKVMAQARPRVPEVHKDGRSIRSCYVTPPAKTVVRHSNNNRNKLTRDPTARGNAGSRNIHTNCKRTGRSPMQLLEEGRGDNRYDSLSLAIMMGQVTASQKLCLMGLVRLCAISLLAHVQTMLRITPITYATLLQSQKLTKNN